MLESKTVYPSGGTGDGEGSPFSIICAPFGLPKGLPPPPRLLTTTEGDEGVLYQLSLSLNPTASFLSLRITPEGYRELS